MTWYTYDVRKGAYVAASYAFSDDGFRDLIIAAYPTCAPRFDLFALIQCVCLSAREETPPYASVAIEVPKLGLSYVGQNFTDIAIQLLKDGCPKDNPSTTYPDDALVDASNGAPWQVVFWALVAICLNILLQEHGNICGLPFIYRTSLRSSPIVALVDGIFAFIKLGYLWIKHIPFRSSAIFLLDKKGMEIADGHLVMPTAKFWHLRAVFFVLGGLFPFVKLYAIIGIPWATAWASFFLSTFLFYEIIYQAALSVSPRQRRFSEENSAFESLSRFERKAGICGVIVQIIFHIWVIYKLIPDVWFLSVSHGIYQFGLSWYLEFLVLSPVIICLCIIWILCLLLAIPLLFGVAFFLSVCSLYLYTLIGKLFAPPSETVEVAKLTVILSGCLWLVFCVAWSLGLTGFEISWETLLPSSSMRLTEAKASTAFFIWVSILLVSYLVFKTLFIGLLGQFSKSLFRIEGSTTEWLCTFFMTSNLAACLAYYAFVYSSDGTYYPSWTSVFG
jgi:hypothetical protein